MVVRIASRLLGQRIWCLLFLFFSPLSSLPRLPPSRSKGYDIENETVPLDQDDALPLIETIAYAADMRKGEDVYAIRVSSLTTVSSFFVLVSGNSRPQIQAIAGKLGASPSPPLLSLPPPHHHHSSLLAIAPPPLPSLRRLSFIKAFSLYGSYFLTWNPPRHQEMAFWGFFTFPFTYVLFRPPSLPPSPSSLPPSPPLPSQAPSRTT